MTLPEHFARADTPATNSPVGLVMVKILKKYPALSFEDARTKANEMIQESAGRQNFALPRVFSELELAARKEHLRGFWANRKAPKSAD